MCLTGKPVSRYPDRMTERLLEQHRAQVCDLGQRMITDRLVVGTSGNISVRVGDLVAATPSGVPYADLVPDAIAVLDLAGRQVAGDLPPTSEVPLHLALYRRPDVRAVVHTHAPHATAVSTLVTDVPPIHYAVALLGGQVRVAAYATFGTPELAESAVAALGDSNACLLANHGAVTVGGTLAAAYERAQQLEWLCQVWLAATSAGNPKLLSPEQLATVAALARDYGVAAHEHDSP